MFVMDTKCLMERSFPFASRGSSIKLGSILDSVLRLTHGVSWGDKIKRLKEIELARNSLNRVGFAVSGISKATVRVCPIQPPLNRQGTTANQRVIRSKIQMLP